MISLRFSPFTLCFCAISLVHAVSSSARPSLGKTTSSTCPARTVNYFTHKLPQQCLTSSWQGSTSTESTGAPPDVIDGSGLATENLVAHPSPSLTVVDSARSAADVWTGDHSLLTTSIEVILSSTTTLNSVVATVIAPPATTTVPEPTISFSADDDALLGNDKFLSFDDWKKRNLQKVGQSEHVGKDTRVEQYESRKRPSTVHAALDSLGDDGEIDLDFSGFVPEGPEMVSPAQSEKGGVPQDEIVVNTDASPRAKTRSKDAGTTCKERFNYASFDCAANILKTNPQAKSSSSILVENKDAYMLNECSADNKFIIVELCNDISVDTIVLANFEFFSSIFRTFRVSVSDRYPVKVDKWKTLGTFEARNTREVQAFLIDNPVIWARYLRIEFITHYGNEYYCPISLVRVHGTTMLEEYKHDLESSTTDDDDEDEAESTGPRNQLDALVPQAVPQAIVEQALVANQDDPDLPGTAQPKDAPATANVSHVSLDTSIVENLITASSSLSISPPVHSPSIANTTYAAEPSETPSFRNVTTTVYDSEAAPTAPPSTRSGNDGLTRSLSLPVFTHDSNNTMSAPPASTTSRQSSTEQAQEILSKHVPTSAPSSAAASSFHAAVNPSSTERSKAPSSSSTQPQPASPTMQESFFKSVQKRLQMLESNSSLSLKYIEDQSRALRDAFNRVEQRQLAKTTTFLEYLNNTVLNELRDFRQQYDHLWQATVIELGTQQERYEHENQVLNTRLGVLADELIFQKRMFILQMILIFVCLLLVLFSRGSIQNALDMPFVQSVLAKSPSSRWMSFSTFETPSQSPPINRTASMGQLRTGHGTLRGHRRILSDDSNGSTMSPTEVYSPSTPVSYGETSDGEQLRDDRLGSPTFDPASIERPSTSPPTLPSGTPTKSLLGGNLDGTTIESRMLTSPESVDEEYSAPLVSVQEATPISKHLTWRLPEG